MNQHLYFYISSFWPEIFTNFPYRYYTFMDMQYLDTYKFNNITILRFPEDPKDRRTKGVFIYYVKDQANNGNEFFDKALKKMWKFLNYLTLRRNHGFMEYHYWFGHKPIIEKDLFSHITLPLGLTTRIHHQGAFWRDLSYDIQESLKDADQVRMSSNLQDKIDNALFYYRSAFFQQTEEMRVVQQFIALEALSEESGITVESELLKEIKKMVKNICQDRPLDNKTEQNKRNHKIQSHIGKLSEEGPTARMRNTLKKYGINIKWENKRSNIGKLYKIRSEIVHTGKLRSIDKKDCPGLCMKMEEIIRRLVKEIIENNIEGKEIV